MSTAWLVIYLLAGTPHVGTGWFTAAVVCVVLDVLGSSS